MPEDLPLPRRLRLIDDPAVDDRLPFFFFSSNPTYAALMA
jgi:hypothetical protein